LATLTEYQCSSNRKKLSSNFCPRNQAINLNGSQFNIAIDAHFSKKDPLQPMQVGYCSSVVFNELDKNSKKTFFEIRKKALENEENVSDEEKKTFLSLCGAHASLIIGRRRNSVGTCELLVRNSYGTDCNNYNDSVKKNCEKGNIWVARDLIGDSTLTTSWIDDNCPN
jgi:hypothetical protein